MGERFEKIKELQTRGKLIDPKKIEELDVSYKIFDLNFQELKTYAEQFSSTSIACTIYDELSKEGLIHLNSYLAAAKALIDHTKVFVTSHYKNTNLYIEYNKKIKECFGECDLLFFIQELRNYTFNKDLPLTLCEIQPEGNLEIKNALCLDIENLRQWSGWTSHSKNFLVSLDNKVELIWLTYQYWAIVNGFYHWFYDQLSNMDEEHYHEVINS